MPRSVVIPIFPREDRRHAALLRAKVDVGIVLRDMMGPVDAEEYFQREGVPATVASRILHRDAVTLAPAPTEETVPGKDADALVLAAAPMRDAAAD